MSRNHPIDDTLPNFDAMDADELMALWIPYRNATRAECAALLPDRPKGYTLIGGTIASYISNLATAKRCRIKGKIDAALVYEGIADRVYQQIPAELRW